MPLKPRRVVTTLPPFTLVHWNCDNQTNTIHLSRAMSFLIINNIKYYHFTCCHYTSLSLLLSINSSSSSHSVSLLSQSHSSSSLYGLSSLGGSWNLMFASMSLIATIRRFTSWFSSWPARATSMSSSCLRSPLTRRERSGNHITFCQSTDELMFSAYGYSEFNGVISLEELDGSKLSDQKNVSYCLLYKGLQNF